MSSKDHVTDPDPMPSPVSARKLDELATQQGIGPVNLDRLLALGDFWSESVGEFRFAVEEWRREGEAGDQP